MGLDNIWKFVRYLLRQRIISADEAKILMARIIEKRIELNVAKSVPEQMPLFNELDEETPF